MPSAVPANPTVALLTMGCSRNEVDSEELAGRLEAKGWAVADDPENADVVLVNTCGFVDSAKKDSIDTILAAADLKAGGKARAVVAVGCLAERYGATLAEELPEADAVLSFDDYPAIAERLTDVLHGRAHAAHTPRDRRELLPVTPAERPAAALAMAVPGHGGGLALSDDPVPAGEVAGDGSDDGHGHGRGHGHGHGHAPDPGAALAGTWVLGADSPGAVPRVGLPSRGRAVLADLEIGAGPASGPRPLRRRLSGGPVAPVKLASGCDRRCSFCAIPSFRGAFLSRPPGEVIAEARWLGASEGVREIVLVSENSTSYGKDLGELRLLEILLPQLAALDGIDRVRVNYLQPAEMRPTLIQVLATTPGVAPYFDLSFQHASGAVLRRMRRFGDGDRFLDLISGIRNWTPEAGIRSNVIVGFPGETEADVAELERFLTEARLDTVGVFGYSDEDGTEAASFGDKLDEDEIRDRVERITALVEQLTSARAEDRIGETVSVLVEPGPEDAVSFRYPGADTFGDGLAEGRAAHQAPEVDGNVVLVAGTLPDGSRTPEGWTPVVGALVPARVVGTDGVDLVAVVTSAEASHSQAR